MQEENKSLNKWNNKEKIILIKKKNWERSPEKKLKKVLKNINKYRNFTKIIIIFYSLFILCSEAAKDIQ